MSSQHQFTHTLSTLDTSGASSATSKLTAPTTPHTMQTIRKMRKGTLLVAFLLATSLLIWGGMQLAFGLGADQRQVQVRDGDGNTQLLPLNQNKTYTITTSRGTNVIEVQDGSLRMASSDCPNHDCVSQGAIDTAAQMIVCMPHQLIVGIVNQEESRS